MSREIAPLRTDGFSVSNWSEIGIGEPSNELTNSQEHHNGPLVGTEIILLFQAIMC